MQTISKTRPIIDIGPKIRRPDGSKAVTSLPREERTQIFLLVFRPELEVA